MFFRGNAVTWQEACLLGTKARRRPQGKMASSALFPAATAAGGNEVILAFAGADPKARRFPTFLSHPAVFEPRRDSFEPVLPEMPTLHPGFKPPIPSALHPPNPFWFLAATAAGGNQLTDACAAADPNPSRFTKRLSRFALSGGRSGAACGSPAGYFEPPRCF